MKSLISCLKDLTSRWRKQASIVFSITAISFLPLTSHAVSLGSYNIDSNEISVSGVSSGGAMATQLHVAYSATFKKGIGIIAGPAYWCAQDNQQTGLNECMDTQTYGPVPLSTLTNTTNSRASGGTIDPTSNMATSKVYLYTGGRTDSGTHDTIVDWRSVDLTRDYYLTYVPSGNIFYKSDLASEHTIPTDFYGNSCSTLADPFISNCGYDAAGAILQHIHGTLNAKNNSPSNANIIQFDQGEFITSPTSHGMSASGWVYVPASCAGGALCKLHVFLHGCKQYPSYQYFDMNLLQMVTYGDRAVKNSGFNKWADTNNMIVLYPQANQMITGTRNNKSNPNGCWDWWGYDDGNYSIKTGRQMAAVKGMVDRLKGGGGGGGPAAPTNLGITGTTSSSASMSWTASSGPNLAGYNVYRNSTKVNGSLVTVTSYTDSGLTANTSYLYVVKAVDTGNHESGPSNTATACTGTCAQTSNFNSIAADDGYVKANADGSSPAVGAITTPAIGRGTDSKFNRTVLSFDTSAIPAGATVTRAYLTVTYSSASGDPWADPAGNTLVIDVKTGTFGAAGTETTDWAAAATASAVATIAKFTSGTKQSGDFSAAGLSAIAKGTGAKTQLKLRFSSNQAATNYIFITEGAGATLTVQYQ